MAKSKGQQPSEVEKMLENPDELSNKLLQTGDFFAKYRNIILGVFGAIVLAVGGYIYYQYDLKEANKQAQNEMYQAVLYFEMDSLQTALEGKLNIPGLLSIADEYGDTKTGNLANFYIGAIYLKQSKFEEAISYLKEFNSDDLLVQPRAYSLIGDAYMELENYAEAVNYYDKASEYNSNEQFSPVYLMKAALAYELNNDFEGAITKYNTIIESYPKSQELIEAKKYKSRAEGLAGKN